MDMQPMADAGEVFKRAHQQTRASFSLYSSLSLPRKKQPALTRLLYLLLGGRLLDSQRKLMAMPEIVELVETEKKGKSGSGTFF
jgi:hypothetical protein